MLEMLNRKGGWPERVRGAFLVGFVLMWKARRQVVAALLEGTSKEISVNSVALVLGWAC